MIPRSLQTAHSSKPGANLASPNTTAPTPQATAASTLPGSHNRISFPILTPQQKRLQQQNKVQTPAYQTSEDGKHIVLHIKHGNSTTMEKSPDGKSKTVHKFPNGGTTQPNHSGKPGGLVPYNDDDDSDSDNDAQRPSVSTVKEKNGTHKTHADMLTRPGLTPSGDSGICLNPVKGPQKPTPERNDGDASSKFLSGLPSHASPKNSNKFTGQAVKTVATVAPNFARSLSSSPLPKPAEDRKWLLNRQHSASPSGAASASALSFPGKAGLIAPLELPVVTASASHPSSGTVVKTSNGNWHVQPQDTGAPSPRGSCSSANSVNSTTEWTLQSKGKFFPFDL